MTLAEYQPLALRTYKYMGSTPADMMHCAVGLVSEINEIMEAIFNQDKVNIGEEFSDSLWYLANYCSIRNYSLHNIATQEFPIRANCPAGEEFVYYASKLSDVAKKAWVYNREIDTTKEIEYLAGCVHYLNLELITNQIDLGLILANNIDKLKVRYPDKYTDDCANNRNIDTERKELEKGI